MEVTADTHKTLIDYLEKAKNENLECEAVLNYAISSINFTNVLQKFMSSTTYNNKGVTESLDIGLSNNVRITIDGNENIQQYCMTGIIPTNSTAIVKKSEDSFNLSDYYYKINLKSEKSLDNDKKSFIIQNISDEPKTYRYKKRFSFETDNFRVDMTVVKSSYNKALNFIESKVINASEKYEIEVEFKNTEATKVMVNNMLKIMYTILKIIFNTKIVVKKSESKALLSSYLKLVNKEFYEKNTDNDLFDSSALLKQIYTNPNRHFLTYQPVTLELDNINSEDLIQNDSILKTEAKYAVTEKADGERYLLFVSPNEKVYLMNNRLNMIDTGLKSKLTETLIDGELVRYDRNGEELNTFMAFDIYFENKQDVRDLPFHNDTKNESSTRYKKLKVIVKDLFNKDGLYKIDVKTFYTKNKNLKNNQNFDYDTILESSYENILKDELTKFPYHIDGLIYQPTKLAVGAFFESEKVAYNNFGGTWSKVYKWKPPDENTIDMKINFSLNKKTEIDQRVKCSLSVYDNIQKRNLDPIKILNGKFSETNNDDSNISEFTTCILPLVQNKIMTYDGDVIKNGDIVEFSYDNSKKEGHRWIPYRIRNDKTELYKKTKRIEGTANSMTTALNVWKSIKNPVTKEMISSVTKVTNEQVNYDTDIYSMRKIDRYRIQIKPMMDFHNVFVKNKFLIQRFKSDKNSLFDIGCGKNGDMDKYIDKSHIKGYNLVVGTDQSFDSIYGAADSAWARYLGKLNDPKYKIYQKNNPMVFVQLDGGKIWNNDHFKTISNDKLRFITQVLWNSKVPKNVPEYKTRFVKDYLGRVKEGFEIVNCQFAIHYFFQNETTLNNFCENLNSIMKKGSHFIGTTFDGSRIDDMFTNHESDMKLGKKNDSVLWMIKKKYSNTDSKIGRKIDVYVESINKVTEEYIVYFDILVEKLEKFNIFPLSDEEQKEQGLTSSYGSFDSIYYENEKKLKQPMDEVMREYSFLNNWFIFKKN